MTPTAYDEGYAAATERTATLQQNPYFPREDNPNADFEKHEDWQNGWLDSANDEANQD